MNTRVDRRQLPSKCSSIAAGAPVIAPASLAPHANPLASLYSTAVVDCLLGLLIGSYVPITTVGAPYEDFSAVSNRRQALLAAANAILLPSVANTLLQLSAAAPAAAASVQTVSGLSAS